MKVESDDCKRIARITAIDDWNSLEDVKNTLKNEAAELGGNTLVLENRPPWNDAGNSAYALVYDCPSKQKSMKE